MIANPIPGPPRMLAYIQFPGREDTQKMPENPAKNNLIWFIFPSLQWILRGGGWEWGSEVGGYKQGMGDQGTTFWEVGHCLNKL